MTTLEGPGAQAQTPKKTARFAGGALIPPIPFDKAQASVDPALPSSVPNSPVSFNVSRKGGYSV
jgi:hypothetical protein